MVAPVSRELLTRSMVARYVFVSVDFETGFFYVTQMASEHVVQAGFKLVVILLPQLT